MTDARIAVELTRANEQLRQEQETFDTQKQHDCRWFALKLVMGYTSILLLGIILLISGWILLHTAIYPNSVVLSAAGAFFADTVGLVGGVRSSVLRPNQKQRLGPVTRAGPWNAQSTDVMDVDIASGGDT